MGTHGSIGGRGRVALFALVLGGCDAPAGASVCEEAMDVVQECTGDEIALPERCDGAVADAAEAIVSGGCDAIDRARDGKGDDAPTICVPELDLPFCDPEQPFSRIATAALDALSAFPDERHRVWDSGTNAQLQADWVLQTPPAEHWGRPASELEVPTECTHADGDCDEDFGLLRCDSQADCTLGGTCEPVSATVTRPGDSPQSLCVGHSHYLYDEFYDAIVQAEERVSITTLAAPDGRFEAAIRNAMTFLAASGRSVSVSILSGMQANKNLHTDKILASALRDVPGGAPLQVWVGGYEVGSSSWNHSKIVAVDDKVLIEGGHNYFTDSYLTSSPVHDISLRISGGPVLDAHRYAAELWRPICNRPSNYALTELAVSPETLGNCPPTYEAEQKLEADDAGIRYISAGRLGKLGADPADKAILAMLDAAQYEIRLSLQDLGPMKVLGFRLGHWPEPVLRALARAAMRDVDVYIVLSTNRGGGFEDYGNGWKPEDTAKQIQAWLDDHPDEIPAGADVHATLCDKLHVAALRSSPEDAWPDGRHFGNHAKFVLVDDEAFYVGSQNLYDANLAEYGLIIDDPDATAQVLSTYWYPLWEQSQRVAVSGSDAPACTF